MGRPTYWALLAAGILSLAVLYADHVAQRRAGLTARYYSTVTPSGAPVLTLAEPTISTAALRRRLARLRLDEASVTWFGYLQVDRDCLYTLETNAGDGATVEVDGRVVVDGRAEPKEFVRRGETRLTKGRHLLSVQYFQEGGDARMDLLLGCGAERLRPVRADELSTHPPSAFRVRYARSLRLGAAGVVAGWIVAALLLVIVMLARAGARALDRLRAAHAVDWWLLLPLVTGCLLFTTGITWGLPDFGTWAPDELTAAEIFEAVDYHFGPGWESRYPPLHYYVLAISSAPLLAADRLGLVDAAALLPVSGVLLAARASSVLMGLGSLWLLYLAALRLFGRQAAVAASFGVAVTTTFVYYSKVANLDVPYVFWFLLSYYFYVRLWTHARPADSYLFALSATLAVGTKDQAYSFYILSSVAVAARFAWLVRKEGASWWRATANTTMVMALSTLSALVAFALIHNWVFNWHGFVEHVRVVGGLGRAYGGMFPPTVVGQLQMLWAACVQTGSTLGWPLFALCLAGIAFEVWNGRGLRAAWLLLPGISYYVFFIAVVGYHYDRFFMPIVAILALFGGGVTAAILQGGTGLKAQRVRRVMVAACFGCSLLQAVSIDALMLTDARYDAERWMREHIGPRQVVGFGGMAEYLPRLYTVNWARIPRAEHLDSVRPDFFVANPEFYLRHAPGTTEAQLYGAVQDTSRYVRVYRYKARHWWNPLMRLKLFSDAEQDSFTNLDKINPTIEIYRRRDLHPEP